MSNSLAPLHRGVDTGGTKLLILDRSNGSEVRHQFATGPSFRPVDLLDILAELPPADTTGLALPGLVDASGVVQDCDVLPAFSGWAPPPQLTALNDGEAALVSTLPTADPITMVVGAGTGIVSSLQMNGVRLRTLRPFAGEFGHMPLGSLGRTLDSAASGAAILKQAGLTGDEVCARLRAKDAAIIDIVHTAGEALGLGLAAIIQLIQPVSIGLYGGALRYPCYLEAALRTAHRNTDPLLRSQCRIELLPDPDTAVARGALKAAITLE